MNATAQSGLRARLAAGVLSLVIGLLLLGVKFAAYRLTGSSAILSDALESVVNVVAAIFALAALRFAHQPADRSHPYGHGKIEFFSAVFEGGLITFAAVLILFEATRAFYVGPQVRSLDIGILLTLAAGLVNAALGAFLIRTGRRHHSLTLVADGQHVLTDFWTSLGVVAGLGMVVLTGWPLFDPIIAAVVGVNLAWTGIRLVRHAAGGLLDEEDAALLEKLVAAMNHSLVGGIIRVHHLRAIRYGRFTHVDAHLVVPEFWPVDRAHDLAESFEKRVIAALPFEGEIVFHTDPCRRAYCSGCEIEACPVRVAPFASQTPLSVEEAVESDMMVAARLATSSCPK